MEVHTKSHANTVRYCRSKDNIWRQIVIGGVSLEGSTGQLRTRVNCVVLAAGNKVRMVCSNIRKLGESC
jgi:hypothetical protein